MSERFVTQFTEVLPKILIIGEQLDLAYKIRDLFQSRNFKTEFLAASHLLSSPDAAKKFSSAIYYKIVYLFNLESNRQSVADVLKILKKRREPILILTRFDSILDVDDQQTHAWFQASLTQYNNIIELARALPRANLLIARDLILSDHSFHPAGSFLFGQISKQIIINPQQDFSFISQANFLEQIQNQFFSPYTGEKIIFQAESLPAAKVFRAFCQFLDYSCEIINQVYPAGVFEFPFPFSLVTGPADLNFITTSFFAPYFLPPSPTSPPSAAITPPVSIPPDVLNLVAATDRSLPSVTIELPPPTAAKVKTQGEKPSAQRDKHARRIISQAKKVLTAKEEKFLHQYLADPHLDMSCRVIDLRGFDFLHCSLIPQAKSPQKAIQLNFYLPPSPTASLNAHALRFDRPQVRLAENRPSPLPSAPHSDRRSPNSLISFTKAVFKPNQAEIDPKKPHSRSPSQLIFSSHRHSSLLSQPKNQKILITAIFAAIIAVFFYFFFFQPRQNAITTQNLLQQFFSNCGQPRCFASQTVRLPILLSFTPARDTQEFARDLAAFLDRYQRLERQTSRYFAVAWQNQSGAVADELKILAQSLPSTLETLEEVQTSYTRHQAALAQFITSSQLSSFKANLDRARQQLQSFSKNLPLLQQLASANLQAAILIFDQQQAQSAGGQFLGAYTFALTQGKITPGQFQTATAIAAGSTLTVNPPELLRDRQLEPAGIYNLGFQRDFTESAALASQLLESATNIKPDLVVSLNPALLTTFGQLAGSSSSDDLVSSLSGQPVTQKETLLQAQLPSLSQSITFLSPEQAAPFVYGLLDLLDAQAMQFYAPERTLNSVLASLNLDANLQSVVCPSGLGSETCYLDAFAHRDDYLAANPGLTQKITHQIDLSPRVTSHTRTITYDNSGSTTPALTYLSFDLPEEATVSSFRAQDIVSRLDSDNGFIVRVEAGGQFTASLKFSITRVISKNDLTYSYYDLHQNGLTDRQLQVTFHNHLPYSPKIIAPSAVSDQQNITFNPAHDQNFFGAVAF